jgi:hypothetical protein
LGESLNVGILFYFPDDNSFELAVGDTSRVKAVYPNFSSSLYQSYFKVIQQKLKTAINFVSPTINGATFSSFIHQHIFTEDAAGLIFQEPVQVKNVFGSKQRAVQEYAKLLLPCLNTSKPTIRKHSESYIIKVFNGYLLERNELVKDKLIYNKPIRTPHFNLKFDFYWQTTKDNYLKPISFDFSEESSIMNKAAMFYAYMSDLSNLKDSSFNFLVSKPQNLALDSAYQNALDFLDSAKGSKKLIFEDQFKDYSEQLVADLFQ